MEELKLRIWNKDKNQMCYFYLFNLMMNIDGSIEGYDENEKDMFFQFNDDNEPMLFTGLKDKNGKEIYEGDIIKRDWKLDGSLNEGQDLFVCELKDQRWLHRIDLDEWSDIFSEKDEVVGNIYENKKVLSNSSPPVQTSNSTSLTSAKQKGFNMGLEVSATPIPKFPRSFVSREQLNRIGKNKNE